MKRPPTRRVSDINILCGAASSPKIFLVKWRVENVGRIPQPNRPRVESRCSADASSAFRVFGLEWTLAVGSATRVDKKMCPRIGRWNLCAGALFSNKAAHCFPVKQKPPTTDCIVSVPVQNRVRNGRSSTETPGTGLSEACYYSQFQENLDEPRGGLTNGHTTGRDGRQGAASSQPGPRGSLRVSII